MKNQRVFQRKLRTFDKQTLQFESLESRQMLTIIAGMAFDDLTGDGFSDDDLPLEGVVINLFRVSTDIDRPGPVLIRTVETDADGIYSFGDLSNSQYIVEEVVPPGAIQTAGGDAFPSVPTYTIDMAGAPSVGHNFANFQLTSISGTKFEDLTGDGILTDNPPLSDVLINLFLDGADGVRSSDDTLITSTVTGSDGFYNFDVGPGLHFVEEVVPAGFVQTAGGDDFPAVPHYAIELISGAELTGNDFANVAVSNVDGTTYEDLTGDGLSFDDKTLAGVLINLFVDGGDGTRSTDDRLVTSATSDSGGFYSFDDLLPGRYFVEQVAPSGFVQTDGGDNFPLVPNYSILLSGSASMFNDFANVALSPISGTKFEDLTGDGISADDRPLSGAVINLFRDGEDGTRSSDDLLVASEVTASDGSYRFSNLGPGRYFVEEVIPSGFIQTDGGDAFPSIPHYTVALASGAESTNNDFANFALVPISGMKFEDLTGDGLTSDDTLLAGTVINLFRDDGDGVRSADDELIASEITAFDSTYSFTNVGPGRYFVEEVVPTGFVQTDGGDDFPGVPHHTVDVVSGMGTSGLIFANARLVTISGAKWNDLNHDGIRDITEPGLSNWIIELTDDVGNTTTTLTDEEGNYVFEGAFRGDVVVSEVLQPGWEQTAPRRRFDSTFALPTAVITGSLATGDLDGNGTSDLISVNDFPASLTLLFNAGEGTFDSQTIDLPPGTRPQSAIAGDFDADDDLDLAVASIGDLSGASDSNGILVLLNDGNGNFGAPQLVQAGDGPLRIDAADVDNNGTLDLVAANFRSNDVSILLGDGSGGFATSESIPVGSQPTAVRLEDLNGDSTFDIVTANYLDNSVSILLGNGEGEFEAGANLTSVNGPTDVVLSDFDFDGDIDLAVANNGTAANPGTGITVYSGSGNGAFSNPTDFATDLRPQAITLFDANGDGSPDLGVANSISTSGGDGTVSMLINRGSLDFAPAFNFLPAPTNPGDSGNSPQAIVAADLDGDQDDDLAIAHYVGGLAVLLNEEASYRETVSCGDVLTELDFGNSQVATSNSGILFGQAVFDDIDGDDVVPIPGERNIDILFNQMPGHVGGDLSLDGVVDATDIDLLASIVNNSLPRNDADLNQDGSIDERDLTNLVESLLCTKRGDANLDGAVSFEDFLILSSSFGESSSANWSSGDFDHDNKVGFSDFLILSANFGFDTPRRN